MRKYIDAERLKNELKKRIELLENGDAHPEVMKRVEGTIKGYRAALSIIDSLQEEQPEGIEGIVHHCTTVHYLATNTKQLNARLKDFEEGAEVRVFINARKEK